MNTAGLRLASSSRSTALAVSKTSKTSRAQWAARRHVHTRKELPYKIEHGLGNFMSPKTLQMVAVEYQQGLLDRLNEECRDVEDKRKTVAQLVLDSARRPDRTIMFKYSSHALNNSFFLNSLRSPTDQADERDIESSFLGTSIQRQFGGFDSLRSLFSAAVNGMAGTGYVWFVTDPKKNLAFVPTFASGTLLIRSGTGTVEPITTPVLGEGNPSASSSESSVDPTQPPSSPAGTQPFSSPLSGPSRVSQQPSSPLRWLHTAAVRRDDITTHARSLYDPNAPSVSAHSPQESRDLTDLGDSIYPLFCLSVHEHCWLLDHGIWGKEKYLKEFWSVVNWKLVLERFDRFTAEQML